MAYYTLVTREGDAETAQWAPQFGDYDKETVEYERDEYRRDYKAKDTKIVRTNTARQSDINAAIAKLNNWREGN